MQVDGGEMYQRVSTSSPGMVTPIPPKSIDLNSNLHCLYDMHSHYISDDDEEDVGKVAARNRADPMMEHMYLTQLHSLFSPSLLFSFINKRFTKRIPLQKYLGDFAAARKTNNKLNGEDVKNLLIFTSLLDILPRTSQPALIGCGPDTRPLTHFRLVEFISKEFSLERYGLQSEDRVGVCLPQGMHLFFAFVVFFCLQVN